MTGASHTFDPIAAAEADIAGSKDLIAAVARDLGQHQRWLAHYRLAEKRHARRVKAQELLHWLELRRRHLARRLRRLALITLRLARTAAAFLWRTAIALFVMLRSTATACLAWLRPRAYAFMLIVAAWTLAFCAWSLTEARRCAHALHGAASISFTWLAAKLRASALTVGEWLATVWALTHRQALTFAHRSMKAASMGAAWSGATSRGLALSLQKTLTRSAAWTSKKAGHFTRASLATASLGFSWAQSADQTNCPRATGNHALTVRRCTALVVFEPRRSCLPAISGLCAPPISSHAVHASP
jgi:hypothetical protein